MSKSKGKKHFMDDGFNAYQKIRKPMPKPSRPMKGVDEGKKGKQDLIQELEDWEDGEDPVDAPGDLDAYAVWLAQQKKF